MRIPLFGVPKRLWKLGTGLFEGRLTLILWRLFLVVFIPLFVIYTAALAGPGGVFGIFIAFVLTTVLGYFYKDDIIAVGKQLWNMEWAEVEI